MSTEGNGEDASLATLTAIAKADPYVMTSRAPKARCAACGLPAHRYGRNEGPDRYDPIACINSLRSILTAGTPTQWCTTHNAAWNNHEGACIDWLAGYNPEADCHITSMLLCTPPT